MILLSRYQKRIKNISNFFWKKLLTKRWGFNSPSTTTKRCGLIVLVVLLNDGVLIVLVVLEKQ